MTEDFVLKDNKNPVLEDIFNREKASSLLYNRILSFYLTGIWEEINDLLKRCLILCRRFSIDHGSHAVDASRDL